MIDPNRLAKYLEIDDPSVVIDVLDGYINGAENLVSNWTGFVFGKRLLEATYYDTLSEHDLIYWPVWQVTDPIEDVELFPDNDPVNPKYAALLKINTDVRPITVTMEVGDDEIPDWIETAVLRIAAGMYRRDYDPEGKIQFEPKTILKTLSKRGW